MPRTKGKTHKPGKDVVIPAAGHKPRRIVIAPDLWSAAVLIASAMSTTPEKIIDECLRDRLIYAPAHNRK